MTTSTLYKVLRADGAPYHGGSGKWILPNGEPGEWMPEITGLVACRRGYHVVTLEQLPRWIGPALFEVEVAGERLDQDDKIVVGRARLIRKIDSWNERTMRLLACDYAEHVLHIFEKRRPGDARPREAIAVARRFANGEATLDEMETARRAAYSAAAAAYAYADAAAAAAYADAAAAAAAAADAADAAAAAAADATAERVWQVERLREVIEGRLYA